MDTQVVERTEVVIGDITYLMTDQQIGQLEVDITPEELEAFKLEVYREQGLPEPELYQDELIGPTCQEDREDELGKLIQVQERMAKGLKLIQEANTGLMKVRKALQATQRVRIPYEQFVGLIQARTAWEKRINSLWSRWFELKDSLDWVDPQLWAIYFNLLEEDNNKYYCTGDSEDIDELVILFQTQNEVADALRDSHVLEMANI